MPTVAEALAKIKAAREPAPKQETAVLQEVMYASAVVAAQSNAVLSTAVLSTAPTPLGPAEQVLGKIAELQRMMQTQAPGYEGMLHTIHHMLHEQEELVHLLSEEQIGIICAGLAKKKNLVIAGVESKSGGKKAGLKNTSLEDI